MSGRETTSYHKYVFDEAKTYLLSFKEVDEKILDKHLKLYKHKKPSNLNELAKGLFSSTKNRRNMGNTIGEIEEITCLYGYDPHQIRENYSEWEILYDTIKKVHNPKSMNNKDSKSYWTIFCKAVISGSNYLSKFNSLTEFDNFVNIFYKNKETRLALPLLLDKEIYGLGFALACDFLKENGYPEYVKPDVHINYIFKKLQIVDEKANDYQLCLDVISYANELGVIPYEVDKLFWLVGSGRFYKTYKERVKTDRAEFCNRVMSKQQYFSR